MNLEIWKDIVGYDGKYQISTFGRVKSFKNGELILKNYLGNHGYYGVTLWKNNQSTKRLIHNILLETFSIKTKDKMVCNHKDGNKLNNFITNLEWTTYRGNLVHAYKNNLNNGRRKLDWDKVSRIRSLYGEGQRKLHIAKMFNVAHSTIDRILSFKYWNDET